jgi:hypothetical protein
MKNNAECETATSACRIYSKCSVVHFCLDTFSSCWCHGLILLELPVTRPATSLAHRHVRRDANFDSLHTRLFLLSLSDHVTLIFQWDNEYQRPEFPAFSAFIIKGKQGRVWLTKTGSYSSCLLGLLYDPEDGGSTFLWNISQRLPSQKILLFIVTAVKTLHLTKPDFCYETTAPWSSWYLPAYACFVHFTCHAPTVWQRFIDPRFCLRVKYQTSNRAEECNTLVAPSFQLWTSKGAVCLAEQCSQIRYTTGNAPSNSWVWVNAVSKLTALSADTKNH